MDGESQCVEDQKKYPNDRAKTKILTLDLMFEMFYSTKTSYLPSHGTVFREKKKWRRLVLFYKVPGLRNQEAAPKSPFRLPCPR